MSFCPKCGTENEDRSPACVACGAPLESAAPNPQYDTANTPADSSAASNPGTLWLWLNVGLAVVALFSCCCFGVLSTMAAVVPIVGIVFGSLSVSDSHNGKPESASSHANVAKILFIVGAALFAASAILSIVLGIAMLGVSMLDIQPFSDWLPKD